jgi:hypothetical protein
VYGFKYEDLVTYRLESVSAEILNLSISFRYVETSISPDILIVNLSLLSTRPDPFGNKAPAVMFIP